MGHTVIARVKAAMKEEDDADVPIPDVGRLIRKSAYLNYGVIVSSLAIVAVVGLSETEVVSIFALTISLSIWVFTFLTALLVSIVTNFRRLGRLVSHRRRRNIATANPLADDWLDGPGA